MANIILYSTGCPKCNVLKKKLDAAGIEYAVVTDMDEIQKACEMAETDTVPILSVLERLPDVGFQVTYMQFSSAIKWVGEQSNAD